MIIYALLFGGLIFRLVNLNQSLWLDEAVQAITSSGSFSGIFSELRGDFHPPLYHLLMWFWVHLFGSSEVVLRLPSVLLGTATIYVIYLIGKQILPQKLEIGNCLPARFARRAGKAGKLEIPEIAALFLATAPFHIYYSQEARMYAVATFFASLSMYFFLKLVANNFSILNKRPLVEYVVFSSLMLYSDYFGLFILLTQAITVLILARKKLFSFLVLQFLCLLLFLPWLPMFFAQLQVGQQAVALLPEWGRLVNVSFLKALPLTFIKFSIGRITIFNKTLYAAVAGGLLVVYGLVIVRGFFKNKKLQISNYQLLITLWLIIPLGFAWLISFFIPNYQPFRLLLVLPAFCLLLALGISQFRKKVVQFVLVLFILGVNLISLSVYYLNSYFHREDWRGVVRYIESQGKPGVAILPSMTSDWPWRYYSEGKAKLIGVSPGVRVVEAEDFQKFPISPAKRDPAPRGNFQFPIYYVRYLQPVFDPQEKIISWLQDSGYVKIREVSFNQIPVWEYQVLK